MSYLYDLSISLFNNVEAYYKKIGNNYFSLNCRSFLEEEIRCNSYDVSSGISNYFRLFYDSFAVHALDFDFATDCLVDGIYVTNKSHYLTSGNRYLYQKYCDGESKRVEECIRKTVYIRRVLNHFILKSRSYYLDDFMNSRLLFDDNDVDSFRKLYNFLSFSNNNVSKTVKDHTYEELVDKMIARKYALKDFVYTYLETSSCRNLILKQQKYYVEELDRLLSSIKAKGNITKYDDNVFNIYLNFINKFRECALMKIESIDNYSKASVKSLKVNL